jgi:vitamin B12 transporter
MSVSRLLPRALCAASLVLFPCAVGAQTLPSPSPTPSSVPQIAHVVTSDRSSETLSSSARTTYVVTRAQIERYGYRTVADAIETLPGVSLQRYGPGAAASSLSLRGSSSAEVLVLVDGVPSGGSQIADDDVATMPTIGVERIEVVEGGGSTLYGSGSMGGIVNIITTPTHGTSASASMGSFGTSDLRVRTPYLSFERALGADDYALPDGTSRLNDDYALWNVRGAYNAKLGSISAQFRAGLTDRHVGVPGATNYLLSATSRQDDVTRRALATFSAAHAATTTTLELGATSKAVAYTCNSLVDDSCPNVFYPAPTVPPYGSPYASLVTESRVQAGLRFDSEHAYARTVYGVDLSRGTARVDDGINPLEIHGFAQTAAYVQQTWSDDRGDSFSAGIRGERDGAQGGALSPSIGGIARLSRAIALRANAAGAFRAPTVEDLYYPYYSNPNLVPERARVGDLTIDDVRLLGGTSLTWFAMTADNLIASYPPAYLPDNVGRASIAGLTLSTQTVPLHGVYAKLAVTNLYRAQDLVSDTRLPARGPVLQANLELGYLGSARGALQSAAITVRNEGARGDVDSTQPLFDEPIAYSSIGAFVRVRVGRDSLLTLRGFNLGNERYSEFAGYPMPGRSFQLELSSK